MKTLHQFRLVALLEGASFLALLFIAMPLKYVAGMPLPTRVAGSVHGLLFVLFITALIRVAVEHQWPIRRSMTAFLSSILPFGTFVFDRSVRREMAQLGRA
jgi:integral membrane protein